MNVSTTATLDKRGRFSFYPDAERVRQMDTLKHADLRVSLEYLADELGPHSTEAQGHLCKTVNRLEAGMRLAPISFGLYYALVEALFDDDVKRACDLAARLERTALARSDLVIKPLDPSTSFENRLFRDMMTADAGFDMNFLAPDQDTARSFESRLRTGLDLLDRAIPELGAEVRELAREILLASSDPDKPMQFDGGSHYKLWGALFLNARFHPTVESVVEVLAHETAHSLLFGFCNDEPLVHNDDDELFQSPLRHDPRPMDGIYHATFVSARMHYAMSRLLESGLLAPDREDDVITARDRDLKNFFDGYGTVERHADLTETGRQLMTAAHDYMTQFA